MPVLDHLVYAVPDLSEAVDSLARLTGVAPVQGGRHARYGTHNALVSLGDGSYLELISTDPDAPAPNGPRPFGLDRLGVPRLNAWAFRSDDLGAAIERARTHGLDLGPAIEMSRELPDGSTLRWELTVPEGGMGTTMVPFFIDWGSSPHPSDTAPQGIRLTSLVVGHPDPEWYIGLLETFGLDYPVIRAAQPTLQAMLSGPAGRLLLT